jgi:voltage-gated potassium channel
MPNESRSHSYQLFVLALCIFALGVLAVHSFVPISEVSREILEYADATICGLFLIDFGYSLARAPDRWGYLYTWGWLDLLSSIPAIPVLRLGRAGRIVRVIRVLRGVRATKILSGFVLDRRAESTGLAAGLLSLLLLVFSSLAIVQFEVSPDSNIKTAGDALWWALSTITTVGYGDRFPVTPEGRLLGGVLMVGGIALFGVASGFVAAWFLAPTNRAQKTELDELRDEVRGLRAFLEERLRPQ